MGGAYAAAPPPGMGGMAMGGQQQQQQQQGPPASVRPPPPAAPNISVATGDTSRVAAEQRPVIASLTALFNSCAPLANNPGERVCLCKHHSLCSFPVKKRKLNLTRTQAQGDAVCLLLPPLPHSLPYPRAPPVKKREMDDNTRKVGQLFWRLNAGEVSAGVLPKLAQLCAAVDAGDWHVANHIQVEEGGSGERMEVG